MASEIWLLGKIKPSWDTETLPTNSDVIGTVYALQTKKCSFSESVLHASREVERQWKKFKLEKMARKNIVRKLEKLVGEYKQLRKCAHQDSEKAVRKRIIFKAKLEQLFDVSVQATETSIKDHKIFRFWMDQKSNRILTASIVNLTDGTNTPLSNINGHMNENEVMEVEGAVNQVNESNLQVEVEETFGAESEVDRGVELIEYEVEFEDPISIISDIIPTNENISEASVSLAENEQMEFQDVSEGVERPEYSESVVSEKEKISINNEVSPRVNRECEVNQIKRSQRLIGKSMVKTFNHDEVGIEDTSDTNFENSMSGYYKKKFSLDEKPKGNLLKNFLESTEIVSASDRFKLSDRELTHLFAAFAKASGENIRNSTFSYSSVRRRRRAVRNTINKNIQENFVQDVDNQGFLIIHWDGKIMVDTTNPAEQQSINADRLVVVISGVGVSKLLGVSKLSTGTGQRQAEAVFEILKSWKVEQRIVGMCFDTTASNTGTTKGACVLLEELLDKKLLNLACRHHIFELVAGNTFFNVFGDSTAPTVKLFETFKKDWTGLNVQEFAPLEDYNFTKPFARQLKIESVDFLQQILEHPGNFCRDDYRQFCELCLLALGVPQEHFFKKPGPTHHARWMGKVIYTIKIFLFRNQMNLDAEVVDGLRELTLFYCLIYVKCWMTAPCAAEAPVNDLRLLSYLSKYKDINRAISEAALSKFKNHLWYLGSELVPLALFSDQLSSAEKVRLQKAIGKVSSTEVPARSLRPIIKLKDPKLQDMVDASSKETLITLGLDVNFLLFSRPTTWRNDDRYLEMKKKIGSLKVVNDIAERAVGFMAGHNKDPRTTNEEELQKILQSSENHCKRYPNLKKTTLA